MELNLVTLCGRYGRVYGEPFLRRQGTLEPMDTPKHYYDSPSAHKQGQAASSLAWQAWKIQKYGSSPYRRNPWFRLADTELRQINTLVHSPDKAEFYDGFVMLDNRIEIAKEAQEQIDAGVRGVSNKIKRKLLLRTRKAPPVLVAIGQLLSMDGKGRLEGLKLLERLCDDGMSALIMRDEYWANTPAKGEEGTIRSTHSRFPQQLPSLFSPIGSSQPEKSPSFLDTTKSSQISKETSTQSSRFSSEYDPDELRENTAGQEDMYASSFELDEWKSLLKREGVSVRDFGVEGE